MKTAILYVSRICLEARGRNCSIDDVCRTIAERCKQREIHGALICVGDCLAQFMEGESEDLHATIADQQADWWHLRGVTAFDEDIAETRFPDWSTAYAGPSYFIGDRVRPLLDETIGKPERHARAVDLIKLIANFRLDD